MAPVSQPSFNPSQSALTNTAKTRLSELDPQGSLKNWSKRRKSPEPHVHQTLPQSLPDVLEEAHQSETHWVFLDTPGHDTATAAAAAAVADLIIIPCKVQSMKDFDSVMLTLAEANRAGKPAYVLMNQVPPNAPKLVRQKQIEIQQGYDIAVLSKSLSRRVDFEYCDEHGLSAAEYNPNGAACRRNPQAIYAGSIDIHHAENRQARGVNPHRDAHRCDATRARSSRRT